MALKITTLIENTGGEHLGLKSEHGLSFFIEKDDHKILFDSGQSGQFIDNARQLKADLISLDYVVLSHGHYDHSGGIKHLTDLTTDFELIMGNGFFNDKYGFKNNCYEFLGNNFDKSFLKQKNIKHRYIDQPITELIPDVYVVSQFPRIHRDEVINPRFKIQKEGHFFDDPFTDEVLVAIDTAEGLVIVLGCSHPGMKNMLDATVTLLKRPIYAILGGTHLVESSDDSLNISLDYLDDDNLKVIGVSHCTGNTAMEHLAGNNCRYFHNSTGSSLIVT
jgi:7,8-dihydropterin-6-yl-methyl-4-(beta-D-ribofuranosyl)aminobenzene 5'-phosphate synthase